MSDVRFSAPDWCFWRDGRDPDDYYRQLVEVGISGVEMVPPERHAAARRAGLTLVNTSMPHARPWLGQSADHTAIVDSLRSEITACAAAGIPHLIVLSGQRAGISDAAGVAACVAALRAAVVWAERHRVTLVFELLNTSDHVDNLAAHTHFAERILDEIDSPAFALLYDVYHLTRMGEPVLADLRRLAPRLGHVHLAEAPDRSAPRATGVIAQRDVLRTLAAVDYRGFVGLEFIPRGDPIAELGAAVAELRDGI